MSFLPETDPGKGFEPFVFLEKNLGFVPNVFRAQTLMPEVIQAQAALARAVLFDEGALNRVQKERILLLVSAASRSTYCFTLHRRVLRNLGVTEEDSEQSASDPDTSGVPQKDKGLLRFCLRLSRHPTWIGKRDIDLLRRDGFSDEAILEAILTTALGRCLCTLSAGLGAAPDFEPRMPPAPREAAAADLPAPESGPGGGDSGRAVSSLGYLERRELSPASFRPFALLRERFGFVPNLFRAQTIRPDVVEAETGIVERVLLAEEPLSRVRKEYLLLAISAHNLNTYCVAVHCEMLRNLGIPEELSEQVVVDHHDSGIDAADQALLDAALKLTSTPARFAKEDVEGLRQHGFSDPQILEGIVMASLTNFLNTLQMGLGTLPDFEPRLRFPAEIRTRSGISATEAASPASKSTGESLPPVEDEDLPLVARVREGDFDAFGTLVEKHKGRLYQTLLGITRSAEDAEDATQEALVKAYQHLSGFQGGSKFSTWLTRIAINEGLMTLRRRKETVSLDEGLPEEDEGFRPRQVMAWDENPEERFSREEIRSLLEAEMLKLPDRYRTVVMLRDLAGLSTEEAARALGLGIPALKTRLFRGHLLLREALAPHFTHKTRREASA